MASNTQNSSREGIAETGHHQTMSNPLAEDYLRWLAPQIREDQYAQDGSYWDLLSIMFETPFREFVPNDDNRVQDGLDLRGEFCYAQHIRVDALKNLGPCSFLEVLIGLSRRLSFAAGGTSQGWAWQLIVNLEWDRMSDPLTRRKVRKVDRILDTVMDRTYLPDGYGGFFPLTEPDEDQTQKELWYQMAAYISEIRPDY